MHDIANVLPKRCLPPSTSDVRPALPRAEGAAGAMTGFAGRGSGPKAGLSKWPRFGATREAFDRILLVAPAQIGDILLCTPALHAARLRWPQARIDVLGFAGTMDLLEGNPDLNEIVELHPSAGSSLGTRALELLRLWQRYDLALVARTGNRGHLAGWIAARRRSVLLPGHGSGRAWKRFAAQFGIVEVAGTHVVQRSLALLAPWAAPPRVVSLLPPPGLALPATLEALLRRPCVVIHVPSMWRYKQWPLAHFRTVIDEMLADGMQVVLTGSASTHDRALLAPLRGAGSSPDLIDVAGQLQLRQLPALLERADAYLGPDTAPTHLAAAVGTPIVTLFGPSRPDHFGPWPRGHGPTQPWLKRAQRQQVGNIVVLQGSDRPDRTQCVPCNGEGCDGHRESSSHCLNALAPERVLLELRRLLIASTGRNRIMPDRMIGSEPGSFPHAEAPEDFPEQIVGAEAAGDLAQAILREEQFLGQQFYSDTAVLASPALPAAAREQPTRDAGAHETLSCVIPCRNEARNLERLLTELSAVLDRCTRDWEVILVDDGSTDATAAVAATWAQRPGFRLLQLSRNFGKEAALSAGLQAAAGDAVIIMDADLQHPAALIATFVQRWRDGARVVYAIRENRDDESRFKRVFTRAFYKVINAADRFEVPNGAGDFRLMDRAVVEALMSLPERNRFMKGLYAWVGFDAVAVPYTPPPRLHGQSNFNALRLVRLSLDGLTAFTIWPLRAVSAIGFLMAIGAFGYGGYLAFVYFIYGHPLSGWTTIVVSLMGLSGIQLISLGVVGEYIGRIFEEVKARPLYVVKRELGQGLKARSP